MTFKTTSIVDHIGRLYISPEFCAYMGVEPGRYVNVATEDGEAIWLQRQAGTNAEGPNRELSGGHQIVLPKMARVTLGWLTREETTQGMLYVNLVRYGGRIKVQSADKPVPVPKAHCVFCLNEERLPLSGESDEGICPDCLAYLEKIRPTVLQDYCERQVQKAMEEQVTVVKILNSPLVLGALG